MKENKNKIEKFFYKRINKIKKAKFNKNSLIFLMFFALSTTLWFINALRKNYTTHIDYPIYFSDIPQSYILANKPITTINLKVNALGYNLLPYFTGKEFIPHKINISSFKYNNRNGENIAFKPSLMLIQQVQQHLSKGIKLIAIKPDTIFLNLQPRISKKIPVVFHDSIEYATHYYKSGNIIINPDSVMVSGPMNLIDSIKYVTVKHKKISNLKDTLKQKLYIKKIDGISMLPENVIVTIPVEPITQKVLNIPVKTINLPDSLTLRAFPANIKVTCSVALSHFKTIVPDSFAIETNFKIKADGSLPDKLKVKLTKQASGVKNIFYTPLFIECLFEKKKQQK